MNQIYCKNSGTEKDGFWLWGFKGLDVTITEDLTQQEPVYTIDGIHQEFSSIGEIENYLQINQN